MVSMSVDVATKLTREGIDVEVLDLRTLSPLDMEAILRSVKKTGKVLIAHEAALTGGFGAEIAAQIAAHGFDDLDAPIARLGSLDTCVPYSKGLEEKVLPQKSDLEAAVRKLAAY